MIEVIFFEDSDEFCEWFRNLNQEEPLDKSEAMLFFFNLDTYENLGVYNDAI